MPDIMLTAAPLDATMGLVGFNVCKNIALKQDEAGIGAGIRAGDHSSDL